MTTSKSAITTKEKKKPKADDKVIAMPVKVPAENRLEYSICATSPEDGRRQKAALAIDPAYAAVETIAGTTKTLRTSIGDIDIPDLVASLRADADAINSGDLRKVEAMLISQASSLQSIYAGLSGRAMLCTEIPAFEINMRMALRAQNQSRATLETLAAIKNPPVVFAKQANISHGHQQVNNGDAVPTARAESEIKPIKQLEEFDAKPQWLDGRAPRKAAPRNSAVETVVAIDRAKNGGR